MRMKSILLVVAMLVALTVAGPSDAQNQSDEWQFQIAPLYLWAMSIDGSMTIGNQFEQDFAVDFADAFDNLEAAFTVHFEASKGRWGLLADVNTMTLAGSQIIDTPGERPTSKSKTSFSRARAATALPRAGGSSRGCVTSRWIRTSVSCSISHRRSK